MKNKKIVVFIFIAVLTMGLVSGLVASGVQAMSAKPQAYSWHYKMTVTIETPEGLKTGSAVREMSNSVPRIDLPDVGNPASVKGEAVVVDLGERGVLFALISSDSDMEFYNAFPTDGPSTLAGIQYYASLPVGTKGEINPERYPSYPKLVTFTDMDDPKSVTLAQSWKKDDKGYYHLQEDRMTELFGQGVTLKNITLEITDEPVTWGEVDKYLPSSFYEEIVKKWRSIPRSERGRIVDLVTFKQGEPR